MTSFVSIIIPCRNEEKHIGKCLETILKQNYPKERMEVLVVDGMSEDKTRKIVKRFQIRNPKFQLRLLDNPKRFTNFAWNLGIKESKGEILILVGAHSFYKEDYVLKCVKYLNEYDADNVGGTIITLPRENTVVARAIALVLSSSFGVGGATFRKGSKKPKWVDTVFGGCYRRDVFNRIGLFNENLNRGQDMEFNIRLKKAGGKILLVPDIVAYYYPKTANPKDFFIYHLKDGVWAILPLKFVKTPFKLRHYIPLIFILTLPLSIWPYILLSLFFSLQISLKEKDIRLFFVLPMVFFCRHFGYGLGSLVGLGKILKK